MNIRQVGLTSLLMYAFATTGLNAENSGKSLSILPGDIVWKAPPTGVGVETAVLYGDPKKAGPYMLRARFPAGFKLIGCMTPMIHLTRVMP